MTSVQEVAAFKRDLLNRRLAELTQKQRDFFKRVFPPNGDVPDSKIMDSIDLCDRTIAKNLKDPTRLQ